MFIPVLILLVTVPTVVFNLMQGNIYLGLAGIPIIIYSLYSIFSDESVSKAGDFLKTLTEEKKESPDELMADVIDNMIDDIDEEDVNERIENLEDEIEDRTD